MCLDADVPRCVLPSRRVQYAVFYAYRDSALDPTGMPYQKGIMYVYAHDQRCDRASYGNVSL